MQKEVAEWLAVDIEQEEIRECTERIGRYKLLAATAVGQEKEQVLKQIEATQAELIQWTALASIARASAN